MSASRINRREFERSLQHLCWKLHDLAERAGAPTDEGCDPEALLAAMPLSARPQTRAMLNAVQVPALDEHPAMAFAARYLLVLADDIWGQERRAPLPPPRDYREMPSAQA